MLNNRELGRYGEDIAARYLSKNGYIVLQKNYQTKLGEIDLVAKEGKCLVFIEVKTRKSLGFGYPREAVNWHKQKRIKNIACLYLSQNKLFDSHIRFDVIEIILEGNNKVKSLSLLKNAFD